MNVTGFYNLFYIEEFDGLSALEFFFGSAFICFDIFDGRPECELREKINGKRIRHSLRRITICLPRNVAYSGCQSHATKSRHKLPWMKTILSQICLFWSQFNARCGKMEFTPGGHRWRSVDLFKPGSRQEPSLHNRVKSLFKYFSNQLQERLDQSTICVFTVDTAQSQEGWREMARHKWPVLQITQAFRESGYGVSEQPSPSSGHVHWQPNHTRSRSTGSPSPTGRPRSTGR